TRTDVSQALQGCPAPAASVQSRLRTAAGVAVAGSARGAPLDCVIARRTVMRRIRRSLAAAIGLILGFLAVLTLSPPLLAQTGSDTLDIFKNLSPDQQESIMQALGGGLGLGNGGLGGGTGGSRDRLNRTDQENPREGNNRQNAPTESEQEQMEARQPVIKADDWVIIEVDYHLPPRPIPQNLQQAYLAGGVSPATLAALQQQNAQAMAQNQAQAAAALAAAGGAQGANGANGLPGTLPLQNAVPPITAGPAGTAAADQQDPDAPVTPEEKIRLDQLITLIRSRNPYQIGRDGTLTLPGFPPIPLLGLSDDNASLRLKADPAFAKLDIRLTRLPLKKTGLPALKPFGYDLFDHSPSTFAPVTNVPVPADYVIGAGDELEVQLYGSQNRTLHLIVGRDGRVNFPEIGPINVQGQLFNTVKSSIETQVARKMIGVQASVSMRDTRAIRVFVLGEARQPGSYTISGLGTITSALYAAGGVKKTGSL